jgi:hypothetical protein
MFKINVKTQKQLKNFMRKRKYLAWYVKEPENSPVELIVEAVLNYGTWNDVQELIKIIGIQKMAEIFKKQNSGLRTNYRPEVLNYFNLYFKKYATIT